MNANPSRTRSILALALIVPISSIAALFSTIVAPGAIGQTIALLCGLWLVIFPIAWHVGVDRQQLRWRVTANKNGWVVGSIIGLAMMAIILASYWFVGRYWLDPIEMRERFDRLGMNAPLMVYGFGAFQTLINSFYRRVRVAVVRAAPLLDRLAEILGNLALCWLFHPTSHHFDGCLLS